MGLEIVAVAIHINNLIFSIPKPARHCHVINTIHELGIPKIG